MRYCTKQVDFLEIPTGLRQFTKANSIEAEAGTNGHKGGDGGHGSRTYIRIEDVGGTTMVVRLLAGRYGMPSGFEMELGGDSELDTIIEAFEFVAKVLKDGRGDE